MDAQVLAVRDGDRIAASGRLIRYPDGDWFEPALPRTLIGGIERQVAAPWRGAVRITGADFGALSDRLEHDGAVEGYASVTGTWALRPAPRDQPDDAPRHSASLQRWDTPPCPPPTGGWPHLDWERGTWERGLGNLDYDLGDRADTGAAVAVTTFRPSQDHAVLVVAAADRDAVEVRLRP